MSAARAAGFFLNCMAAVFGFVMLLTRGPAFVRDGGEQWLIWAVLGSVILNVAFAALNLFAWWRRA